VVAVVCSSSLSTWTTPAAGCERRPKGDATLIVDLDPCLGLCAKYGLERARVEAGLDELIVRGPNTARRYADGLGNQGEIIVP